MKNRGVINLINKQTGEELRLDLDHLKATRGFCPSCHHKRTDKRNRSFRWNAQKGYGFCYYCNVVFYDKDRTAYNTAVSPRQQQPQPQLQIVEIEFITSNQ